MKTSRVEAFSDGVLAIAITIMVLEMKVPQGSDWAALMSMMPVFGSYVLSFIYVGIYWNNHHHLFQVVDKVDGAALWANQHLLFWLSLIPFVTRWLGESRLAPLPTALYGTVLLCSAIAWVILQSLLASSKTENARLKEAVGNDWKGKLSLGLNAAGIALALVMPWSALVVYILVAFLWLIPDRRFERAVEGV